MDSSKETVRSVGRVEAPPSVSRSRGLPAGYAGSESSAATLGRYLVVRTLGAGAFGVVYEGYDPKLRRPVALKLMRSREEGVQRFVLEARAMARLTHPHVATVYDVEALARHQNDRDVRLVLVMEYVAGTTLARWAPGRGWRDVLARYLEAGRGLAAAHGAGILHRDFKPDNVLIGTLDGRPVAKVTDFGIAKLDQRPAPPLPSGAATVDPDDGVTQAGLVMGTLPYMSPEQHGGGDLGPAADQYAFCVSVWQSLCGRLPFAGDSLPDLVAAKLDGPGAWTSSEVPAAVVHAIRRGLEPGPDDRWPSMSDLVAALSTVDRPRGRNLVPVVAGTVLTVGAAAYWAQSPAVATCEDGDDRLHGVWDEQVATRMRAAMLAVDASFAAPAWERASTRLDDYAAQWVEAHRAACRAGQAEAGTGRLLDRRMACLERARDGLGAVTSVLAETNVEVLQRSDDLLEDLLPVAVCEDPEHLPGEPAPPRPSDADAVQGARRALARVDAELTAGRPHDAQTKLEQVMVELSGVDYPPVAVEADLLRGRTLDALQDIPGAVAAWQDALRTALAIRSRVPAHEASIHLLFNVGTEVGLPWAAMGYASLARGIGAPNRTEDAAYRNALAMVLDDQGASEKAVAELRAALEIVESLDPPQPLRVAVLRNNLSNVLTNLGRYEEGEQEIREALRIRKAELGDEHPSVGSALSNLCLNLVHVGKLEEAEHRCQEALRVETAALGPDSPRLTRSRQNLGLVWYALGRLDEAEAMARRVLEEDLRDFGELHLHTAKSQQNLAVILRARGRPDEAEPLLRSAIATRERLLGLGHPTVADLWGNLVNLLADAERWSAGEVAARRALATSEVALGANNPAALGYRNKLVHFLRHQDRVAEALVLAERSWALVRDAEGVDLLTRAEAGYELALLLGASGPGHHRRAQEVADRTLALLEEARVRNHPEAAEVVADLLRVRDGASPG